MKQIISGGGALTKSASASEKPFGFGKNWSKFLEHIDPERIEVAQQSITDFLGVKTLRGKSFVDIGCGSGLFSLAALKLGAERVVSFDVDGDSVRCCQELRQQEHSPDRWRVIDGSVLDRNFIDSLGGPFDVVYAWGSLHHTGDMWRAIENASALVGPSGYFYLSIYNKKRGVRGSKHWLKIKRFYTQRSAFGKKILEWLYIAYYLQSKLLRFKNPWRKFEDFKSSRGMYWKTNLIDWLGGYPYEYATINELFRFVTKSGDMTLANMNATDDLGTHSVLFRRDG